MGIMKQKRIRAALLAIIMTMSLCAMPFVFTGGKTVNAAVAAADFFSVDGGTLTATPNYTADRSTGVKLDIAATAKNVKVNYKQFVNVADLDNMLSLQALPNTVSDNEADLDFEAINVYLEDSADSTQQLAITLGTGITGDPSTTSKTGFVDSVTKDMYGGTWINNGAEGDDRQYLKGWYQFDTAYNNNGSIFYYGDTRGYGTKNSVFNHAAGAVTPIINYSLRTDKKVYVSDSMVADLKDNDFLTKSSEKLDAYPELKARYSADYVDNLFSSGQVKLSFEFASVKKVGDVYNNCTVNLLKLGGQNVSTYSDFSYMNPGIYYNRVSGISPDKTAALSVKPNTHNANDNVWSKARLNYNALLNTTDLNDFITIKMLPSENEKFNNEAYYIYLEDSADATQQLAIAVTAKTGVWNGGDATTAKISFVNDLDPTSMGTAGIAGTDQKAFGFNNFDSVYDDLGAIVNDSDGKFLWTHSYGVFAYTDDPNNDKDYVGAKPVRPITFSFAENKVNMSFGGKSTMIADIANADFLAKSSAQINNDTHPEYKARYTSDYVNNLFSSGKVKLSVVFSTIKYTDVYSEQWGTTDRNYPTVSAEVNVKGTNYERDLVDTVAPIISVDDYLETYEAGTSLIVKTASVFDMENLTANVAVEKDGEPVIPDGNIITLGVGTYTVTYTATDTADNIAVPVIKTFTVVDTTAPIITAGEYAESIIGKDIALIIPTINDSVDGAISTYVVTVRDSSDNDVTQSVYNTETKKLNFAEAGTYKVIYSATDSGNNTGKTEKTVVINPKLKLTVADYNSSYEGGGFLTIKTATSNRATMPKVDVTVLIDGTPVNKEADGTYKLNKLGTCTVTYTATDSFGSSDTVIKTFTVVDTTAPVITAGEYAESIIGKDIALIVPTINDGVHGAISTYVVTVRDSSDNDVTLSVYNKETKKLNFAEAGTYKVIYSATDSAGNDCAVTKTIKIAAQKGGCKNGGAAAVFPLLLMLAFVTVKKFR